MKWRTSGARVMVVVYCALFLLTACGPQFQVREEHDIPISVSKPGSHGVDLDLVYDTVNRWVHEELPDAYFTGMVYMGKCHDLPQFQGRVILTFLQERQLLLRTEVIRASAFIDTTPEKMSLSYEDLSGDNPSTEHQHFEGDTALKTLAGLSYQHIVSLGLHNCDVTVSHVGDWRVTCGTVYSSVQPCDFKVVDGKAVDVPR